MRTLPLMLVLLAAATSPLAAQDKLQQAARKAREQHRKNQTDQALKTMEKAAAQAPGGAGALALSRFRAELGGEENLAAALAAARRAVTESAAGAAALKGEALGHLAGLELRLAGSKEALAHAEQAVQAAATPETLATLARVQVRRGRPAGALETAEKAVAAGANSAAAWSGKGFALLGLDRPAEAADAFRKALAAEPARHPARVGLAAALLGLRRAAEAEAEARQAVDEKTGDPRAEEGFAVLGLAILAARPDDSATWTQAIGEAQNGATVLNPKNPEVKHAVGRIFEHSGDLAQALTNYQAALGVDPGYVRARQALVQVLVWQKKAAEAVAAARAGVAEDPGSADALRLLGQALLGNQAYAEAIPPLEQAAKLAPTHAVVHAALGSAHRLKGQLDRAAASYKRAIELAPAETQLRLTYGDVLAALKQPGAAAAEYAKVAESPGYSDPMAWIKLGSAHRRTAPPRTDQALAAYRKALELDPSNATAAFGVGFTYQAAKRYDEAIRAFQEAARVAPDLAADAEVSIAWGYVGKGDPDRARIHLVKAGRVEPELEQYIFRLARGDKNVTAPPSAPEGPDMAQLTQWIQSRNAATRERGVRGLCRAGADGADNLIWVLVNEAGWELRELAVTCLGNVGPAAREAVPYLRQILRTDAGVGTVASDREMKDEASLADLKRKAKAALARIER